MNVLNYDQLKIIDQNFNRKKDLIYYNYNNKNHFVGHVNITDYICFSQYLKIGNFFGEEYKNKVKLMSQINSVLMFYFRIYSNQYEYDLFLKNKGLKALSFSNLYHHSFLALKYDYNLTYDDIYYSPDIMFGNGYISFSLTSYRYKHIWNIILTDINNKMLDFKFDISDVDNSFKELNLFIFENTIKKLSGLDLYEFSIKDLQILDIIGI